MTAAAVADCRDSTLAKIETCPYIERWMRQSWIREIFNGRESTVVALLVLYLPNLKSITISDSIGSLGCLERLISTIDAAHRKHKQKPTSPLSQLSHLRLDRRDAWNDDSGASLPQWLPIVAGLPSSRRLSGEALIGHCSKRSEPLPEFKQSKLPRLRGFHMEVDDKFDGDMGAPFMKAGIDLVCWKVRNAAEKTRHEW